jgi:hypothetical protein
MRPHAAEPGKEPANRGENSRGAPATTPAPQTPPVASGNTLSSSYTAFSSSAESSSPQQRPQGYSRPPKDADTVDTLLDGASTSEDSDGTVEVFHPGLGEPPTIDRLVEEAAEVQGTLEDTGEIDTTPWDDVPTISDIPTAPPIPPLPPSAPPAGSVTPVTPVVPAAPPKVVSALTPELLQEVREQVRSEVLSEVREAVYEQARTETLQERWRPLVERLVELYAELERDDETLRTTERPETADLSRHIRLRLQEVLGRGGVTVLSDAPDGFDRTRHETPPGTAIPAEGTAVARFLSPAFLIEGRILRRARVEVTEKSATDGSGKTETTPPKKTGAEAAPKPSDKNAPALLHEEDGDTLEVPPLPIEGH